MITTPEKLLEFVKEKNVKWIDLQFMDMPGRIQHITIPSYTLKDRGLYRRDRKARRLIDQRF